jgi:hypothetical protein
MERFHGSEAVVGWRHRFVIIRQSYDDLRALAARAGDLHCAAHLFRALAHAGQTQAIVPIFNSKSVTIVSKFQANLSN